MVFFDEIDAIAPRRSGSGADAGSHVTERVISQMLTEMDGLEDLKGVVVIGATNRLEILDEALVRPGRFDRIIEVPMPDQDARKQIFLIHTSKKPLDKDVKIEKILEMTSGMTGAEIAAFVNATAIVAIKEHIQNRDGSLKVMTKHFEAAIQKVRRKKPAGYLGRDAMGVKQ